MKKRKTPTVVTSAVLTLITVFFWAGFEVYRSLTIKPEPSVPAAIINPLDPTLDTDSLNNISQRTFLDDSQITNITNGGATPQASPTTAPIIPVSTASATPTVSPSPVPSPTP